MLLFGLGWRALRQMQLLAGYQFRLGRSARILPFLVTWRHRGGQEQRDALYIDCKLQRLDWASTSL
jgi:hypothetical protein